MTDYSERYLNDFKKCTKTIKDCPNCPKLLICDEYEEYQPCKTEIIGELKND